VSGPTNYTSETHRASQRFPSLTFAEILGPAPPNDVDGQYQPLAKCRLILEITRSHVNLRKTATGFGGRLNLKGKACGSRVQQAAAMASSE